MMAQGGVVTEGSGTDREDLYHLYRTESGTLLRMAALMLSDIGEAEEVVQGAFVRCYLAWHRLADSQKGISFLRSAVLNCARSRLRRAKVAARLRLRPATSPSAEEGAMRTFQRVELAAQLSRLSTRQRECVVLRYYAGLSEQETADDLGISLGSVKTHSHRGLVRLAEMMGRQP